MLRPFFIDGNVILYTHKRFTNSLRPMSAFNALLYVLILSGS